ncbi:MAG: AarF/ABC1/UbiB kinase family protein, partial [Thermostichales cyanobacterium SRBZ-1_bins_19]
GQNLVNQLGQQALSLTTTSLNLPRRIESTLTKLENGDLRLRVRTPENERLLRKLIHIGTGIIYAILAGSLLTTATQLGIAGYTGWAVVSLLLTGITAIALLRVILRLHDSERLM